MVRLMPNAIEEYQSCGFLVIVVAEEDSLPLPLALVMCIGNQTVLSEITTFSPLREILF